MHQRVINQVVKLFYTYINTKKNKDFTCNSSIDVFFKCCLFVPVPMRLYGIQKAALPVGESTEHPPSLRLLVHGSSTGGLRCGENNKKVSAATLRVGNEI